MARFTSYGTCTLCGKHTSKGAMTRHLAVCPAEHEAAPVENRRASFTCE